MSRIIPAFRRVLGQERIELHTIRMCFTSCDQGERQCTIAYGKRATEGTWKLGTLGPGYRCPRPLRRWRVPSNSSKCRQGIRKGPDCGLWTLLNDFTGQLRPEAPKASQTTAASGAGFVDNYRLGGRGSHLGPFLVSRGTFCVKIWFERHMGQAWIITSRAWECTSVKLWPGDRVLATFFFSRPPQSHLTPGRPFCRSSACMGYTDVLATTVRSGVMQHSVDRIPRPCGIAFSTRPGI